MYQSETGERLARRSEMQPFMVGYFGFKAFRLSLISLDQFLATQVDICRIVINFYDKNSEINQTLNHIVETHQGKKPTAVSEAETQIIQKFVVQK